MIYKQYFLDLTDYITWADHKLMDWLTQLNNEQWEQVITSSFPTIKQTALHIVSAEKIWIEYWKEDAHPTFLSAHFKGSHHELLATWQETSEALRNFIRSYPEEKYLQPVSFKWPSGKEGRMEFWQTFSHFINHATYHRGQLVTMLRQAGFTNLSSTDLATYYRLRDERIAV